MKDLQKQAAETAFVAFTRQLVRKDSKGFITETENGKIFSFESYLRETGQPEDVIASWCGSAKNDDFLMKTSKLTYPAVWSTYVKVFFVFLLLGAVAAMVLYVIVAALLLIVGVSLWNWKGFLYSVGIGIVLIPVYLVTKSKRKQRKAEEAGTVKGKPLFVIKYFDNDELTFTKAKSRLFVEK